MPKSVINSEKSLDFFAVFSDNSVVPKKYGNKTRNQTEEKAGCNRQKGKLTMNTNLTSKDQEREALEKIKAIVEGLGQDSYIGTALEGCLEIAEENIENDFACSMKQRVEAVVIENTRLKETVKDLEDKLAESEKDYEAAHEAAHLVANEKDAEIARLQAMVISSDDLEDIRQLLKDRVAEDEMKATQAATEIVEHAEDTTSNEFQSAVRMHRAYIASVDYTKSLMDRLQKAGRQ